MTRNTKTKQRSGKTATTLIEPGVAMFTSRGAVGQTSTQGNQNLVMTTAGNPFTADQGQVYTTRVIDIDCTKFFAPNLFNAYEYYRVEDVETTFTWLSCPEDGKPIGGELLFAMDQDSRELTDVTDIANRGNLQTRTFTNNSLRHVVTWKPYLVENRVSEVAAGDQLDYVQPRNRWLNTKQVQYHRFGTVRCIALAFDKSAFELGASAPNVQVRHRVKIAMKGLKSTQATPANFREVSNSPPSSERVSVSSRISKM